MSGLAEALGPGFKGTVFAPINAAFDDFFSSLGIASDAALDSSSQQLVGLVRHQHSNKTDRFLHNHAVN